ncbi:hypothetical protein ACWCXH_24405 [Kitasatospora sp. NPDC001660]
MAEQVRKLTGAHAHHRKLSSRNGTGFALTGFSRKDAEGNCFATRWFTLLGIGVVPLARLYVREGETTTVDGRTPGGQRTTTTTTRYAFLGIGRLKAWEIVRHYLFWLVTIPASALPSWWLIVLMDHSSRPGGIPLFLLWLAGVISMPVIMLVVFVLLLHIYRARLAPVYEVEWVSGP